MNIYDYLRMRGAGPEGPTKPFYQLPQSLPYPQPGLRMPQMPAQAPPQSAGPQKPEGLLAKVLGGADSLLGGSLMQGLSPEQREESRRRGLLAAGASLLESSGPSPYRTTVGQGLGRALQAGAGGYEQGYGVAKMQDAETEAKRAAEQRAALLADLAPKPGENPTQTYQRLQQAFAAAMQTGDVDMMRSVSEVLKTVKNPFEVQDPLTKIVGNTMLQYDPETKAWSPVYTAPQTPRLPTASERNAGIRTGLSLQQQFYNQTKNEYSAKNFVDAAIRALDTARSGSGAAQVQTLYAFVKALDPNSVVREGEVQLSASASPVAWEVKKRIDEARSKGERSVLLAPQFVEDIGRVLHQQSQLYGTYINDRRRQFYDYGVSNGMGADAMDNLLRLPTPPTPDLSYDLDDDANAELESF